MRCNLQLSDEERSFLILQALHRLFEVHASIIVPSCMCSTCNVMNILLELCVACTTAHMYRQCKYDATSCMYV